MCELRTSAAHERRTFQCRVPPTKGNRLFESAQTIGFIGFFICGVHCGLPDAFTSSDAELEPCQHTLRCSRAQTLSRTRCIWVLVVVLVLFTVLWRFGLMQQCREERARLARLVHVGARHNEHAGMRLRLRLRTSPHRHRIALFALTLTLSLIHLFLS